VVIVEPPWNKPDIDTQKALNFASRDITPPWLVIACGRDGQQSATQHFFSPAAFYALTSFLLQVYTRWFYDSQRKLDA
jgi:hypothetical protein